MGTSLLFRHRWVMKLVTLIRPSRISSETSTMASGRPRPEYPSLLPPASTAPAPTILRQEHGEMGPCLFPGGGVISWLPRVLPARNGSFIRVATLVGAGRCTFSLRISRRSSPSEPKSSNHGADTSFAAHTMNHPKRLASLQAGRGIAAIAVVLHHAAAYAADKRFWGETIYRRYFDFGALGVEFFFVLIGV